MKKKSNKTFMTVVLVMVVAFGLLGAGNFFNSASTTNTASTKAPPLSTRELALNCTLDIYTRFHIHPHLKIIIDGAEQIIPANVGITPSCVRPIHTHDSTGTIHVESPEQRDFTLGDFFAVWQKPFSRGQILNYEADRGHEITMTVDGGPSNEFENLVLVDEQKIIIEYASVRDKK